MNEYQVDVMHKTITPVYIKATNQQEAIERVLNHEGDTDDSYPGEVEVLTVKRLDD